LRLARPMACVVRKRHFFSHLYIKCIILPRQARDKHRENSKKCRFLAGYNISTPCTSMQSLVSNPLTSLHFPSLPFSACSHHKLQFRNSSETETYVSASLALSLSLLVPIRSVSLVLLMLRTGPRSFSPRRCTQRPADPPPGAKTATILFQSGRVPYICPEPVLATHLLSYLKTPQSAVFPAGVRPRAANFTAQSHH
jgi:hypothetical protein